MNIKIKQFAEQAGFDVYGWNEKEFEKFAELIVKECANVSANEFRLKVYNDPYQASDIREALLKHFGVEL